DTGTAHGSTTSARARPRPGNSCINSMAANLPIHVEKVLRSDEPIARVVDSEGADAVVDREEERQGDQNEDIENGRCDEKRTEQLGAIEQEPVSWSGSKFRDRRHGGDSALSVEDLAPLADEAAQLPFRPPAP